MENDDVRTMYDEKDYIFAFDLAGKDVTLTIERVQRGTLVGQGGKSNKKPIIFFRERPNKGFACNITNSRTIASLYGGFQASKWIGKKITLYPTTTQFGNEPKDCIRIRNVVPK